MTSVPALEKTKIEYGDFQTPPELAQEACQLLKRLGFHPAGVLEPTCGLGNFLQAAIEVFPGVQKALGVDINAAYVLAARNGLETTNFNTSIIQGNFFDLNWHQLLRDLPDPLLIVGNPPWVTNSVLGAIGSQNLPRKSNFQNYNGFDALTGKSNFDISEWMLIRMFEWLDGRDAAVAMLCKTAVARKVLAHSWKTGTRIKSADIFPIDAQKYFGASVEAGFLIAAFGDSATSQDCVVHTALDPTSPGQTIGRRGNHLLADVTAYERLKHLHVGPSSYKWRSGIKHDCSKIMELFKEDNGFFRNGLDELVELEDHYLYPMLKSSEVASQEGTPTRFMLVTQRAIGENTTSIKESAPKTWDYLEKHAPCLDRRPSVIYKKRPRFSIFGVGDYSFSPCKVVISGFYKKLEFKTIHSFSGKPVMLDDTSYFLPCKCPREAELLISLLNSPTAREFLSAFIFWDAKRPITVAGLSQLSIESLAREYGKYDELFGDSSPNARLLCQAAFQF